MLPFSCPLSVSLLPRLTVSPSYDGGAYTSGYLYLILSKQRCRTIATTRRTLGSGLPSADRMATPRHATISLPLERFSLSNSFPSLSLRVTCYSDRTASPHATFAKEVVGVVTYDRGTSKKRNASTVANHATIEVIPFASQRSDLTSSILRNEVI